MPSLLRSMFPVLLASLLTAMIWIIPAPETVGTYRATEVSLKVLKQHQRGPVKQPSDWFMMQRVGPDGTLNIDAVRDAEQQALALRARPSELDDLWQFEGPSNVGGRITGIAVHPDNPSTIYAAGAIGGVFKSTDGGDVYTPIFEEDFSQSAGAIAIDPNNMNRIWYGAGEANSSGDSYPGKGIYLTEDAGASWTHKGLPEAFHIGRIVIDPTNSERIFVAAAGKLFGFNSERGVYRTENGGDSWDRVFYIDDSTACIDIEINQLNPDTVFAVMWERYRLPSQRQVSGPNSGLWRSIDGGDTWSELTSGLPINEDNLGRGSLAISPTHPDFLVLTHTDHPGRYYGAWRSYDGGDTWEEMSGFDDYGYDVYNTFGWYFGGSIIAPGYPFTVYIGGLDMFRSDDGGNNWTQVFNNSHVDHHDYSIDPNHPTHIVSGHDGGVNISLDSGNDTYRADYLGATQFYAITHDPSIPHRLYGGTQDNGTWGTRTGGINNWEKAWGGDGFYCLVDPRDSDVIYVSSQWGSMYRLENNWNDWYSINDGVGSDRSNWMTPFTFDPFNYDRLYRGSYRIWGSNNRGESWVDMSGDLTDGDDPGNLTYGTITTISASAAQEGLILVGTDDANVWYTDNFGVSWHRVDEQIPDVWVSRVATHPDSASVFFVALSGHRIAEPMPHLYRSDDYGTTWYSIVGDQPEDMLPDGPINDIIVDPDDTARLYVGTDYGVFGSSDHGQSWAELGEGLPMSAVFDIEFVASGRRLIAGTHGRSMYSIALDAVGVADTKPSLPTTDRLFLTSYPNPFNANTTVRINVPKATKVSVEIFDLLGRSVSVLTLNEIVTAGVHEWSFSSESDNGRPLASGTYLVVANVDTERLTHRITLLK
jgi:hypothetical protein